MRERKVQRIDPAEIVGVERMLCADPAGRACAEITLERRQNRVEHGYAWHAEITAAGLQARRKLAVDQSVEDDAGRPLDVDNARSSWGG